MNMNNLTNITKDVLVFIKSTNPIVLILILATIVYFSSKFINKIFKSLNESGFNLAYANPDAIIRKLKITQSFTHNHSYRHAITIEEAKDYLLELASRHPEAFHKIDEFEMAKPNFHDTEYIDRLFGDFDPHGSKKGRGKVRIYPLRYHKRKNMYSINVTDSGMTKLYYTEQEAKEAQLFTIGHEFKHNIIYHKGGPLGGTEIEEKCDNFSEKLKLARRPSRLGKIKTDIN